MTFGFNLPENMQCNTIYLLVKGEDCDPLVRSLCISALPSPSLASSLLHVQVAACAGGISIGAKE